MRFFSNKVLTTLFFVSAAPAFAGAHQPLIMEVPGRTPVIVQIYDISEAKDPLQLNVHIGPEAATALQKLSKENVGKTLVVKQGGKTLMTPTIKSATLSQDIMLSFKTGKDLREFREGVK